MHGLHAVTRRARLAAEIGVGLLLVACITCLPYRTRDGGLLGIGVVLWMRWRTDRADAEACWERHLAGALAIPLAFETCGGVIADGLRSPPSLWIFLPGAVITSLLITRPRAGLGALAACSFASLSLYETDPLFGMLGLPALVATGAHALRTRTLRLPSTYVAAGLLLVLASAGVANEHLFVGDLHERIRDTPLPQGTWARIPLQAAMLVAAIETLRGRTAGLLALILLTLAYGLAAPVLTPHFHYGMHCMPVIVHPLDDRRISESLVTCVALPLVMLWAAPVWRWMRAH